MQHFKDEILNRLALRGNVAQFVSFRPGTSGPVQSFARIANRDPNQNYLSYREALEDLLECSPEGQINIRSYMPGDPRSREFIYGLDDLDVAVCHLERLTAEGLSTIANETVDINDGGVSGVVQGTVIEFSPDDTPRCVEKPGVASMPFNAGIELLTKVYGFRPDLQCAEGERTEFSIHPRPRGWRTSHTLIWEHEKNVPVPATPNIRWPNRFSRMIGDKAFGLLVADLMGAPVPRTVVIPRRIAPFSFGQSTGSAERWIRTSPFEPQPGLYTTHKGWLDPFQLLAKEDPEGMILASVLCQDAVNARFSGAAIVDQAGTLVVEGLKGEGDAFMLGTARPENLPADVLEDVRTLHSRISRLFGTVRLEWVHDGARAWLVQCHIGATETLGDVLVPGKPEAWADFDINRGLEALRDFLDALPEGDGVVLRGEVGATSHFADLVRRKGAPARISVAAA